MKALQVVFLVRRMDVVVVEAKADQHSIEAERVCLKSATIGIEAPEPISTASLPHSSVSARFACQRRGFMFQSERDRRRG